MVGVFSGLINAAMLAGSIYMLQVYDRVLSSRSVPTLIGISLLLLFTYLLQGLLDAVRARMLARIGASFDERISPLAFTASRKLPLMGVSSDNALQPLRDVDAIRSFLASIGPTALFDLPWMPLFFIGCFLLHPWLGWLAVAGGGVIILITALSEWATRKNGKDLMESGSLRRSIADASRRNAEILAAMGMGAAFDGNWQRANARHLRNLIRGADAVSGISSFAKIFRLALQSTVLGLGAYLVIKGDASGGAMIAASIMTSRALAPIETAVANWRGFVTARQGYTRLARLFGENSFGPGPQTTLPPPEQGIEIENLAVRAPGRQNTILNGISFRLQAGAGLGVIGPSGSGKSTLARALVGAWPPLHGEVRLDGAALHQWEAANLGRHIGYLPQDIELLDGTVAENIARFSPDANDEAIVAAAKAAGAHGMIVKLDNGYDTRIGEEGASLSGGQRQRIGLARALYGMPFLVVLDEPNSNLDHAGDEALNFAIKGIRARGGIVVIITHRPAAIAGVDQIAILADGRLQAIGPRDQILKNVIQQTTAPGAQRQSLVS
ncbi:type I secretion system permease/ATPase [Bosea beijingensis]|uniref:type I secretion system permease/ATPase n=1 Tax=Bosea beijingensis TaxID=3068632 RepID=UPI002741E932|nr:type I secretion system permease/ATPase [Bosea sp. REN20]